MKVAVKLILIRHGQTSWNLRKKYSGFIDIGLSKKGRLQAARLCERLKNEKIDKVYVSDRKRAIQTAEIVFKGIKAEEVPDLREIHFGVFEGLTYKEAMKKYPVIYKKWLKDPFSVAIPKGENLKDFEKRVKYALRKIICLNRGKTVAVVSHGGAISIFINSILKTGGFWNQIPCSASISIVGYKNGKARMLLFNDIAHLLQ